MVVLAKYHHINENQEKFLKMVELSKNRHIGSHTTKSSKVDHNMKGHIMSHSKYIHELSLAQ